MTNSFDQFEESAEQRQKIMVPLPPLAAMHRRGLPPPAPGLGSQMNGQVTALQIVPTPTQAHESQPVITLLNSGSRITGKLFFEGQVRIDCHVEGEILAHSMVIIGTNGSIVAQIKAESVVIEGRVNGDVFATHRIELRAGARVLGNLCAPGIMIHDGAIFEGHCSMKTEGTAAANLQAPRPAKEPEKEPAAAAEARAPEPSKVVPLAESADVISDAEMAA